MPLVWAHFIIDAVGFLAPGILTLSSTPAEQEFSSRRAGSF